MRLRLATGAAGHARFFFKSHAPAAPPVSRRHDCFAHDLFRKVCNFSGSCSSSLRRAEFARMRPESPDPPAKAERAINQD
jgi:hypothetical protein